MSDTKTDAAHMVWCMSNDWNGSKPCNCGIGNKPTDAALEQATPRTDSETLLLPSVLVDEHLEIPPMAEYVSASFARQLERELAAANDAAVRAREVVGWAQATLTGLNVGDVRSGSMLHLKLREVMINYRKGEQ